MTKQALALLTLGLMALAPRGGAQTLGPEAGFLVTLGRDTLAAERFTRTATRLVGELRLRVPAPARVAYDATVSDAALLPLLRTEMTPPGAQAPIRATVTFRGDSMHATVEGGGAAPEQRFRPGAGALPYINLSGAILEQMVLRARAVGAARVEIPMLNLLGGQAFPATVSRLATDSVLILLPPGVEIRARVDAAGRLLGATVPAQNVTITRVERPVALAPPPPPDYSAPADAPYTAEEVRVSTPAGHTLAGTLTLPRQRAGRVPAVVLISGSGPQDRDETLPMLSGFRPFRQIADTLGRRGIAVLRLDDRGSGASTGARDSATTADYADDMRAALAYLRTRPEIDPRRLGLVGHSEGGTIAPMVAAQDAALRALVLLAGTGKPGREILAYQLRQAIEHEPSLGAAKRDSLLAQVPAQIDSLAAAQRWMRFFVDYDPLPTARRVTQPVLILQGATDRQVTAEQATLLAQAFRAGGNRDVTVRVLPDVNHLFLADPGGSPAGYAALPNRQVVPEALGTLADWLAARMTDR